MIKRVDNAVYLTIKAVQEGTYEGGVTVFDLAVDGVGYSDNAGNLTDDLKAAADKYADAIKDGQFAVPATQAEFEAFEAPAL
jgi:basic membrane protein A